MGNIFHIYASHGPSSYVELDLPASDYEMLDLMERLRLEPGQLPYVELLKIREEYDYLDKCICEQPDIYQLNALARKLSEFTSVLDMAAFEGMAEVEMRKAAVPIEITKLIDFAHSTDYCHVAENAMTDHQLGKFLVENDFIADAIDLPDAALALLDYGKIGREHREQTEGVYTGFGYVEVYEDVRRVSETMDFQPRKPDYTILLNMAAMPLLITPVRQEDMVQLRLPAPEEQVRAALEKLGRTDWNDIMVSIWDSPIPCLNHTMYFDDEAPQILELAECFQKLDAAGEMTKYKAILAANNCDGLSQAISLAGTIDEHLFEPKASSPEDVAREELKVVICDEDAATLLPHIDLQGYGRALLERDHAIITEYGLIEQTNREQMQDVEQQPGPGGMEMM